MILRVGKVNVPGRVFNAPSRSVELRGGRLAAVAGVTDDGITRDGSDEARGSERRRTRAERGHAAERGRDVVRSGGERRRRERRDAANQGRRAKRCRAILECDGAARGHVSQRPRAWHGGVDGRGGHRRGEGHRLTAQ